MIKPKLFSASFTFTQEGNTNLSASELEQLTIDYESRLGIDEDRGGYWVLRTEGWSIDSTQELQDLLTRIQKINPKKWST